MVVPNPTMSLREVLDVLHSYVWVCLGIYDTYPLIYIFLDCTFADIQSIIIL